MKVGLAVGFGEGRGGGAADIGAFGLWYGGLAGGGDVFAFLLFVDFLGAFDFVVGIGGDGDEVVPGPEFAFVDACFDFGNAEADQAADDSSRSRADGGAAECSHDGAGRDEWADARDGERANADEEADDAARNSAGGGSGGGAFGGLGGFDVADVVIGIGLGHEHGDVRIGEAGDVQAVEDAVHVGTGFGDTEYGGL